jgi:hypothetical protein
VRYDPFDLLFRRVTFEGEIRLFGPITFQLTPSWIFDSPSQDFEDSGFAIGGNIAWYVQGDAMRGFWVKAHVGYEVFDSTLFREFSDGVFRGKPADDCDDDSAPGTCTRTVQSTIVGLMIGSSTVFGRDGGFAINGGIGIGAALADPVELRVDPCTSQDVVAGHAACPVADGESSVAGTFYDKTGRIQFLGSLGLGVAF